MKRILFFLPLAVLCINSCKPNLEEVSPSATNLNFSNYVAVGDYITAGYTNGGLNLESQKYAYPNILAQQFATVGGPATFLQPDFPGGTQMITLDNITNGVPTYSNTAQNAAFLEAACTPPPASAVFPRYNGQTNTLQNLGVPGLLITQLLRTGLGNSKNQSTPAFYNPYFERMLPANDDRTYFRLFNKSNPTFFTCWLGMGDVINYAMNGGSCGTLPTNSQISALVTRMVDSLSAGGTKQGVIANIPSVQYLGFAKVKPLELQAKFQQQTNNPNLKIWITSLLRANDTNFEIVPVRINDFITPAGLAALGKNGHGLSQADPLTAKEVLDFNEVTVLEDRISISGFNKVISGLVDVKTSKYYNKVVLVDMQQLYGSLNNGVIYNGVKYELSPVSGGFYSNDYFSPTARGQAIISNAFIQTINEKFGTNIFKVNVNDYPAYQLP